MSEEAADVLARALALPPDGQWAVVEELIRRLDGSDPELPLDDEDEWREELDRRLKAVADGTAELVPWATGVAGVRAELVRRRPIPNCSEDSR